MKYLLPVLAVVFTSCGTLQYKVPEQYVAADRATYNVLAPVITALADTDPDNDPNLTGANGSAILLLLQGWDFRVSQAEETFEVSASE